MSLKTDFCGPKDFLNHWLSATEPLSKSEEPHTRLSSVTHSLWDTVLLCVTFFRVREKIMYLGQDSRFLKSPAVYNDHLNTAGSLCPQQKVCCYLNYLNIIIALVAHLKTQLKLLTSVWKKQNTFLLSYAFLTLGIKKFPSSFN